MSLSKPWISKRWLWKWRKETLVHKCNHLSSEMRPSESSRNAVGHHKCVTRVDWQKAVTEQAIMTSHKCSLGRNLLKRWANSSQRTWWASGLTRKAARRHSWRTVARWSGRALCIHGTSLRVGVRLCQIQMLPKWSSTWENSTRLSRILVVQPLIIARARQYSSVRLKTSLKWLRLKSTNRYSSCMKENVYKRCLLRFSLANLASKKKEASCAGLSTRQAVTSIREPTSRSQWDVQKW